MARSNSPLLVERIAARHEHAGVGRVELDRRVEVGDGAVEIALGEPHAAAVGIGAGVRRGLRPIASVKSSRARGGVALGAHRQSPVVVQDGEIGSPGSGPIRSAPCRR